MELGWTEDEQFTIERVKRTKRQLEDEIEVSKEISRVSRNKRGCALTCI